MENININELYILIEFIIQVINVITIYYQGH